MATPTLRRSLVAPGVRWDERKGRYIGADGRIISRETVREVVELEAERVEAKMLEDAAAYRAGRLTRPEFQRRFETNIRRAHQAGATIARGGFAQLSRADKDWTRARVREQFGFLEGFLRDIAKTPPEKLDGRFEARVALYARAARSTQREADRRLARLGGDTEEKRFLGGRDHCQPRNGLPGCPELARLGWRPIGTLPPIGATVCAVNCRCYFKTRRAEA